MYATHTTSLSTTLNSMKLYATIENEKGKREGIGGNEYLDIDIRVGNELLAALTVRELGHEGNGYGVYDADDTLLFRSDGRDKCDYCGDKLYTTIIAHSHTEGDVPVIEKEYHERHAKANCPCKWCTKGKKHSAK